MFTPGQLLPERPQPSPITPLTPLSLSQLFFFSPVLSKAKRKDQVQRPQLCNILSRQNQKEARVHLKGRTPQTKRLQLDPSQHTDPSVLINDSDKMHTLPNTRCRVKRAPQVQEPQVSLRVRPHSFTLALSRQW